MTNRTAWGLMNLWQTSETMISTVESPEAAACIKIVRPSADRRFR